MFACLWDDLKRESIILISKLQILFLKTCVTKEFELLNRIALKSGKYGRLK